MRWCALILTIFFISVSACPVFSANRVALVIGNSDYQSAPLRNPVNDANDIAAVLSDLGFEVIKQTNTNKRDTITAIDKFAEKLKRAEVGLFYFAGHGMQINGRNYLIPLQVKVSTESDVEFEAVDVGRVMGKMRFASNKLNIVILDACRNNPFYRTFRTTSQGLATMDAPLGTIVAYATAPGSVAADGTGRNGIYTKHLLKALKKPNLDIQDIFNEAGMGVMNETGRKQIPWTSNTPLPRYYFTGGESTSVVSEGGTGIVSTETGSLQVSSTPSGAEVLLNGTNVGKTPLTLDRIHTGLMEVKVIKGGYKIEVKEVLVKAGGSVEVDLVLEQTPTTGTLTVQTTPTDARVRILNIKPTYQPGMELAAGRYHVEVSADDYEKKVLWAEIGAGEELRVDINLKPEVQKVTGQGQSSTLPPNRGYTDPTTGMEFVFVPGRCFMMGDTFGEGGDNEKPVHEVCVDDFYIGKYEVTQKEYSVIMSANPSLIEIGDDFPVHNVTWYDTQAFILKLEKRSGQNYRLPTEAEWEYAANSGGKRERYSGGDIIDQFAWYSKWGKVIKIHRYVFHDI